MLDSETKRRIDSCRDILVGKVPDPKSQVEQITIALIYKFMDDMDAEAEELGGKRSFFAGDYARFGWAKLMSPGLGGFEVLALYSEAIQKMNENPGVLTLFRDIFKNAYLPYRDPETLKSFLKEINYFAYDHSERLGDAFEYLLSVLGSQGDAGQFRTPRHIIDFMVEVMDPKKFETILDPACGTAGFLISAWKHILKSNTSKKGESSGRAGALLTPDERARLAASIHGYDISPDMVRLSLVNLYLHGFTDPRIEEYDTLTSDDKWNEVADVILANPPFMSPKGGIKPHKRFTVTATRSEVLFVDYMAEHLTATGRAAIVVPEGIIFQSGTAYKALRKLLVNTSLVAVVSLPAGVFNPYSGVKTSILILDKRLHKQLDSVLFVKVGNDGFNLGAQRRAVVNSDLPEATRLLRGWMTSPEKFEWDGVMAQAVERTRLAENGEFNLSGERYKLSELSASSYPAVALRDISIGKPEYGSGARRVDFDGKVRYVRITDIEEDGRLKQTDFVSPSEIEPALFLKEGDVLFARSGSVGRCYLHKNIPGTHQFAGYLIRFHIDRAKALPDYGFYATRSRQYEDWIEGIKKSGTISNINAQEYGAFELPLPPLEVQNQIVAEIEGYQKIIDGARQVLDNYKPHIVVEPDWPLVSLGTACDLITDGTHFSPESNAIGDYKYITAKNIKRDGLDFKNLTYVTEAAHKEIYARCSVKRGDVLYIKDGATAGIATINTLDEEFSLLSSVAVLRGNNDQLENRFLSHFLNSDAGKKQMLSMISGVAITRLTLIKIKSATLPLPDLPTQRAIVAEIEAEQTLVNANRELIRRMEAKVKAAIDRVWGESV